MRPVRLPRREFVRRACAGAFLLGHETMARGQRRPVRRAAPDGSLLEPRILSVVLRSGAPLRAMREFYADRIGFSIAEETPQRLTLKAGATLLTFEAVPDDERPPGERAGPLYHFAFNIPRNALRAAHAWQSERSALVPPRPTLIDPAYPDTVWHFAHWNAHSLFFFDPAFNIVEYIARHDLPTESPGPDRFEARDILYVSEIGLLVHDQAAAARTIQDRLGLSEYPRGAAPWAMGDERGLLLCLARVGQPWAEWTDTPVTWGVFPTEVTIAGDRPVTHEFADLPYRIRAVVRPSR